METTCARAWMNVVNRDRRRIPSGDGWSRSLDLEGPQVCFWVLTRAIHQRQTGQQQHCLLIPHATDMANFDTDGIDAIQENIKFGYKMTQY